MKILASLPSIMAVPGAQVPGPLIAGTLTSVSSSVEWLYDEDTLFEGRVKYDNVR